MKEKFIKLLEQALDHSGARVVCYGFWESCDNECSECPVGSDASIADLIVELKE